MDNLLFLLLLLHVLLFSSLPLFSSAYTSPDEYFINCGSASTITVPDGRNFTGDENSGSFTFSSGQRIKNTNSATNTPLLYQTARVFEKPSSFELQISQDGTYMVRLHFYPFSSPKNLFDAKFNVSTSSRFSLLSDFSAENSTDSPVIKEFLVHIPVGKFTIYFTPLKESSFAFANGIEVFILPVNFTTDTVPLLVAPTGSNNSYNGWLSGALHTVHRINVGGSTVAPGYDKLWRNWVPDDDYLISRDTAINSPMYGERPKYDQPGGATEYIAPDSVYRTAKELNNHSNSGSDLFNITWRFNVSRNAPHLVRFHICDIISNGLAAFTLYVYRDFKGTIDPYQAIQQVAAPFYADGVVDSDSSGFINISVGPPYNITAFLNGVEIMEIIESGSGLVPDIEKHQKIPSIILGSVVGSVAFMLIVVFLLGMKFRKKWPAETWDWEEIPLFRGWSSPGNTIEMTTNIYLGLKLSFVDIQNATNNFDKKLMIGEGGFGKVYKGTLRSGMKVAVKRSEPGRSQGLPEFQMEIMVLSKIRHRHLVSLIGYCDERSQMILVYEFMEKGTLRDHLYDLKQNSEKSSIQCKLSWIRRLEICIGAAKGLHYLHTSSDRGIIHRDVKSTNILLDENYVAKVADFGLSRLGALDQTYVSTEVKGSFGYLDPEYFRCLQLTQKSDVYSFGVVILEVLCARPAVNKILPLEEINLAEWGLSWLKRGQLEKIVDPFLTGQINPNSLRMVGEIVEKCLREYGVERPSMHDVYWDLVYALRLQQTGRHREPHEDSTADANVSWVLPVPSVQRLPSSTISMDAYDVSMCDFSDQSHSNASEVFSQLRIGEAR